MDNQKKTCFIISPIGEIGSETRKRADQILRYVINPAVTRKGYDAVRADKISEPGIITSQVIQHLVDDSLVIADLTGSNANVFYELAIRHAVRRPFIQLIEKDEKIPFDVAGMRTIPIDHKDLDSAESAREEIIRQIDSSEARPAEEIETPISSSIQIQQLRQSGNPIENSIANLVNSVSEFRTQLDTLYRSGTNSLSDVNQKISNIEQRISSPENLLAASYFRLVSKEFNLKTRSFRTIVNETLEFLCDLERDHFFNENEILQAQMKKRMQFILHMIKRELGEE